MRRGVGIRGWSLGLAAFALALAGATAPSQAEDFPEKPVTVIIPFSAGGSHDVNARVFTSVIPDYLGQPVIVKLTPGAGGQKGTAEAIEAPADGYTLLFTHNYIDELQPLVEDLPYDTNKDLVMVARVNSSPPIYWVRADSPWQTLDDLIADAKANPGKIRYAHSGKWGTSFTGGAELFSSYGVENNVTFLPYKGGGPTKQAVLSGDADFTVSRPSTILSEIEAGTARPLLVGGDLKELFPNVPTTEELGFGNTGVMHRIVLAPAGIPEDRLEKLRAAFRDMQEDKTYNRLMKQLGEDTDYLDGPDYQKLRDEQAEEYKKLVNKLAGS
jgi:tripartite-type tricarboxylate transporter receptor subunit TctC